MFGFAIFIELTRGEVETVLVKGFFPEVEASASPGQRARTGLTQLGLPYAADPAITKHLAHFLTRQAHALTGPSTGALLHPTAVLFNGGVVKS